MAQALTGPLASIRVNGITIGRMKSVRADENFPRGSVVGLGEVVQLEAPLLSHKGTLQCEEYAVDYKSDGIQSLIREAGSVQQFIDNVLLNEQGVQVVVFKKVVDSIDPSTNLAKPKYIPFATLNRVLLDREGFNVSESQIGGKTQSFIFLDPIIYSS